MTVADAVRLKEELTKAIDDAEKDKKEEQSKFTLALSNAMADTIVLAEGKDDDEMSEIADKQAKRYTAELLSIAKKQLNVENLKDRALDLTKQLNESGLDENSIEYNLIEFMCNLMDCPNWSEIVETAGLYAGRIKAEALKDLPMWKKATGKERFNKRVIVLVGDNDLLCTNYAEEGEYYLPFRVIVNLPKED